MTKGTRRKRALAALAGLVGAIGLGEIVCRVDALFPGASYDPARMRGFLESRVAADDYGDVAAYAAQDPGVDPVEHRPVPDPWSGWSSPSILERVARGTQAFTEGGGERRFDVLLLGGSFAAQLGNAWGQRMDELLGGSPSVGGRPIELWNFSVAAQKQPSHLHRLTGLLALGWKPDLVVCVDGYNELAISSENAIAGIHPVYPSATFWNGMARAGDVDRKAIDLLLDVRTAQQRVSARARAGLSLGVWRSALLSRAWSAWLSGPQADYRAARTRYAEWTGTERSQVAVRGPLPPGPRGAVELGAGVAEGVAAWVDGARNLRAICDDHGIALVHALQPGLDDEGSKPASDEETRTNRLQAPWRASIRLGYPRLRAGVAELAARGVVVHDGSRLYAERTETLYVDGCHVNERGYVLYGEWLSTFVRDALAAR